MAKKHKKIVAVEIYQEDIGHSPTSMILNGAVITEKETFSAIDVILDGLYKTNDLAGVDATLQSLLGLQGISGKALAKLLWGTRLWWDDTGQGKKTGDTFEDYIFTTHGLKGVVVDRYISVWDSYEKELIPADVQDRPLKDQIAIAKTLEQGYHIKQGDWKKLAAAANNNEVLDLLRKVKGTKPRKSSLQIKMERDGTLNAWDENGKHYVGWLDVDEEATDPAVHKAIERILSCGITRR